MRTWCVCVRCNNATHDADNVLIIGTTTTTTVSAVVQAVVARWDRRDKNIEYDSIVFQTRPSKQQ